MEGTAPMVVTFVVAIILILYGSHLFSKYVASGALKLTQSKNMKIIDRILVGKDSSIAVVKVGGKYYLIGISASSMSMLAELSEEDISVPKDFEGKPLESLDFKKAILDKYIGIFKK